MSTLRPKKKSLIAFLVLLAMFPIFALLDRIVPPEWATLKQSPLLLLGVVFILVVELDAPIAALKS